MVYTSVGHIIYIDRGGYPQNLSTVNVKILCDEYSISFVKMSIMITLPYRAAFEALPHCTRFEFCSYIG